MKGTDGILVLLQDIKAILFGIAWLILGGILCIVGAILDSELGFVLIFTGIITCLNGITCVYQGHGRHEVIENKDE